MAWSSNTGPNVAVIAMVGWYVFSFDKMKFRQPDLAELWNGRTWQAAAPRHSVGRDGAWRCEYAQTKKEKKGHHHLD